MVYSAVFCSKKLQKSPFVGKEINSTYPFYFILTLVFELVVIGSSVTSCVLSSRGQGNQGVFRRERETGCVQKREGASVCSLFRRVRETGRVHERDLFHPKYFCPPNF